MGLASSAVPACEGHGRGHVGLMRRLSTAVCAAQSAVPGNTSRLRSHGN